MGECPLDLASLKRNLVGTALGRSAMRARQFWTLLGMIRANPEDGGRACQEACASRLLPGLCGGASAFVDVGAHIGSVIAEVRRCYPTIQVIGVEAVLEKAASLRRKFPDVEVHGCAVGDTEGEATFFVDLVRPGYSSLACGDHTRDQIREITVPIRRLDCLVPASADVGVIKLDVEGAELAVLRGATELIARCRPVIFFESGRLAAKAMGFTTDELFDWFVAQNYEIFVPNRVAHNGPPLSREGFHESQYYPVRTGNYFGIPAERRVEVRDRARRVLGIQACHSAPRPTPVLAERGG
jgi:FkbM family methyltransferase